MYILPMHDNKLIPLYDRGRYVFLSDPLGIAHITAFIHSDGTLQFSKQKLNNLYNKSIILKQRSHRKIMPWIIQTEFNLVFFRIDNENEKE